MLTSKLIGIMKVVLICIHLLMGCVGMNPILTPKDEAITNPSTRCVETIILEAFNNEVMLSNNVDTHAGSSIYDHYSSLLLRNNYTVTTFFHLADYRAIEAPTIIIIDDFTGIPYYENKPRLIVYLGDAALAHLGVYWRPFICQALVVDIKANIYNINSFKAELNYITSCARIDLQRIKQFYSKCIDDFEQKELTVNALINPPYIIDINGTTNPGIQILIFEEVAKIYNIAFKYTELENSHIIVDWVNSRADFIIGTNSRVGPVYELFMLPWQSEAIVVVPAAPKIPNWLAFVKVFRAEFWALILASILLNILATYFIAQFAPKAEGFNKISACVLQMYAIFLAQSMHQAKSAKFKFLFLTFTLYSLVIAGAYTGLFLGLLMRPMYGQQIRSIPEILDMGLGMSGSGDSMVWAREFSEYGLKTNPRNYKSCSGVKCLEAVSDFRNVTYFTNKEFLRSKENSNVSRKVDYFDVNKNYLNVQSGLGNKAIVKIVQEVVYKLSEAGIMTKWVKDTQFVGGGGGDGGFTELTFAHFYIAWGIMIFGSFVASVVFFLELFGFY